MSELFCSFIGLLFWAIAPICDCHCKCGVKFKLTLKSGLEYGGVGEEMLLAQLIFRILNKNKTWRLGKGLWLLIICPQDYLWDFIWGGLWNDAGMCFVKTVIGHTPEAMHVSQPQQ